MAKQLKFEVEGDRNVHVWPDIEKMQQVLLKYVSNAIRNGNEGSTIQMDTRNDCEHEQVYISLENEGPSIPFISSALQPSKSAHRPVRSGTITHLPMTFAT